MYIAASAQQLFAWHLAQDNDWNTFNFLQQLTTSPVTPGSRQSYISCVSGPRPSSTGVAAVSAATYHLSSVPGVSTTRDERFCQQPSEVATFADCLLDRCGNGLPSTPTTDATANSSQTTAVGVCWSDAAFPEVGSWREFWAALAGNTKVTVGCDINAACCLATVAETTRASAYIRFVKVACIDSICWIIKTNFNQLVWKSNRKYLFTNSKAHCEQQHTDCQSSAFIKLYFRADSV